MTKDMATLFNIEKLLEVTGRLIETLDSKETEKELSEKYDALMGCVMTKRDELCTIRYALAAYNPVDR